MKKIITKLLGNINFDQENDSAGLEKFQRLIQYKFTQPELLTAALSHTSLSTPNLKATAYERMEFLGDSILGLVTSEELFHLYPDYSEGQLSKLKSKIVSKKFLALKAKEISLGNYIKLSSEAINSGGRNSRSILGDSMESLICALYLDGGLPAAKKFIHTYVIKNFQKNITNKILVDHKSKLQELTQARFQQTPEYKIVDESGPEHEKIFSVEVFVNKQKVGFGKGSNKKEAQQNAALEAYKAFSE